MNAPRIPKTLMPSVWRRDDSGSEPYGEPNETEWIRRPRISGKACLPVGKKQRTGVVIRAGPDGTAGLRRAVERPRLGLLQNHAQLG